MVWRQAGQKPLSEHMMVLLGMDATSNLSVLNPK